MRRRVLIYLVIIIATFCVVLYLRNPQLKDVWLWIVGLFGIVAAYVETLWKSLKANLFPATAPAKKSTTITTDPKPSNPSLVPIVANSSSESVKIPTTSIDNKLAEQIALLEKKIVDQDKYIDTLESKAAQVEKTNRLQGDTFIGTTLTLLRFVDDGETTLGLVYLEGNFFCYTLEDTFRKEKISGKTRIPAGTYTILFNKNLTELTQKYRARSYTKGCIGRGIVRAGFDFSKLVSEDIHLSETSRTIFITNATSKILSVELNPWFIPQRKVKGFEILNLQSRIDETDIRKLKTRCKEMIRQQAEARKIVAQAKRNGEEALFNFFKLVSKDPVNQVVIVSDYLDEMRFLFDTVKVFSPDQALDIYNKSILYLKDSSYYIPKPDSLKGFLKKLKLRNSRIDYAFGIKDSLHQLIDKKVVPFSLAEIDSLRNSDLKLDTTRLIHDARKRDEFVEESWNRL